MAQNNTNRKPRAKKWASEVARQQHSNHRRKLAREASDRVKREQQNARDLLSNARGRIRQSEEVRRNNMVMNGMQPRLVAVMNSWGLRLPVNLRPDRSISGWTDFKTINVCYDERMTRLTYNEDGTPALVNERELREIAAECRAVFYHEVGHNLFTIPMDTLLTLADQQGFTSPRVAMLNREQVILNNKAPEWRIDSAFRHAWNMLEDQRMETALTEESPFLASYLTVMVLRNIVNTRGGHNSSGTSWALVAGRKYLPESVREKSRAAWNVCAPEQNITATDDEVEAIIHRYSVATDARSMLDEVEAMFRVFENASFPSTTGHHPSRITVREDQTGEAAQESLQRVGQNVQKAQPKSDDSNNQKGDSSKDDEQNDADEGEGNGNSGSDASSEQSVGNSGKGAGEDGPEHDEMDSFTARNKAREEMLETHQQVLEDLMNDAAITEDVTSMNEAYNLDDGALQRYNATTDLSDDDLVAQAQSIVDDIVRSFDIATADCAPHWESGQRRGVLEPIRYRTRQPGDLEFFRAWAEDGEPGTDIAVSLFVDISGSMMGSGDVLGATAWAVKTACDRLSIDCDVTAFDHDAYRLWGKHEQTANVPELLSITGGTDPNHAFRSILSEERSNKHHVVLIMTDGAWSDNTVYQTYRKPNHHTMVFFYQGGGFEANTAPMAPYHSLGMRLSVNEAYTISNLMDIPRALENMLVSLV